MPEEAKNSNNPEKVLNWVSHAAGADFPSQMIRLLSVAFVRPAMARSPAKVHKQQGYKRIETHYNPWTSN